MTAPCPPLSHLAGIIAGWERAEGIRILHAWISDYGDWRVEWIEGPPGGTDLFRGGGNHLKVSRLIADLKDALKAYGIDACHIANPGPGSLRAWTTEGQFLWWNAPATEPTRAEAVA